MKKGLTVDLPETARDSSISNPELTADAKSLNNESVQIEA
jgi:hypothetical protein